MTREEINLLGIEELETRAAEIATESATAEPEALEALNKELDAIEERKKVLAIEAENRKKAADAVKGGAGKPVKTRKDNEKMTNKEIRNSKEYIDAFAKYIKTGKDAECRSLLTENVEGNVPVPTFIESRVRTAWERDEVWNRIRKTNVRGNLKVGYEISATGAALHEEGTEAPDEENLTLGIVQLVPQMIKKWITVSHEVMALGSEEFLAYVYDEITYKIIQKASETALADVIAAMSGEVLASPIDGPASAETIIDAIAELGDDARDLVFIADGATIASIRKAAIQANFAYDPFQGMTVIKKTLRNSLGQHYAGAIVGDLSGIQANLPEGDDVRFIFDEYSLAEEDLVKIVGRLYAAIKVTEPGKFAVITPGE